MSQQQTRPAGLEGFVLSRSDLMSPLWQRFHQAMQEELSYLRSQNDHDSPIAETTRIRGQIGLVKRILARADEVGPESRQSEPVLWPESAPARTAAGMPEGY